MKLKKIVIKNYKCLKDIEIPIHNFNLLIGENDSGKSSILDAMELALAERKPEIEDFFKDKKGKFADQIIIICIFKLNENEKEGLKKFSINEEELNFKKVFSRDTTKKYVYATKFIYDDLNLSENQLNRKTVKDLDKILEDLKIKIEKDERKTKDKKIEKIINYRLEAKTTESWIEIKNEVKNYLPRFIKYDTNDYQSPEQMVFKTLQMVFDSFIYQTDEESEEKILILRLKAVVKDAKIKLNEKIKKLLPYVKQYNDSIKDISIKPDIDFSRGLKPSPILLKDNYGEFSLESKGEGTKKRLFLSFLEWDKQITSETENQDIIRGYDEPDTSLHYDAQRKLFYSILEIINQENSNIQALLCTHSLTMIDRANPRDIFHLILNKDGITNLEYLKSFEDEDIELYLTELSIKMGLPNSSIFFERCFLIIEGSTEEHCLPMLYFKKYGKRFIEDGIRLINIEGIGNAMGFLKLLGKNKEHCILLLLDNDCNSPDTTCNLTPSGLEEIGFSETFIRERGFFIGRNEFEDSFKNKTIMDTLNYYWPKHDGSLWIEDDINKLRTDGKFSDSLIKEVNIQSRKKSMARCTKPKFGEKLAEICEINDYPNIISVLFEKSREISLS